MKTKDNNEQKTILVLIEPSSDTHIALDRALFTSRSKSIKPKLHLCICASDEKIANVTEAIEKEGLDYDCEFCDSTEQYISVLNCAERIKPALMLLPDYKNELKTQKVNRASGKYSIKSTCPAMILGSETSAYSEHGFTFADSVLLTP